MAVVDDRVFWECNSDLNADNQINPDDAILFKALINYEQSEKKVSFADVIDRFKRDKEFLLCCFGAAERCEAIEEFFEQ